MEERILKNSTLLLTALLCIFFIYGCANQISSNDFIHDPEVIDEVSVGVVVGEGEVVNVDIKDELQVSEMLDLLKNVEVEKFSVDKVNAIYENAEIWSQNVKFQISLIATSKFDRADPNAALKGFIVILEEGNLLFVDPKTMGPFEEDQIEKTAYYISKEIQTENINKMVRIIEEKSENIRGKINNKFS